MKRICDANRSVGDLSVLRLRGERSEIGSAAGSKSTSTIGI
jgi:hypothetical protein